MLDNVHEECGICAVYVKENGETGNKALFYLYKLLLNLQNRGQLSAGITTYNEKRKQILDTYKDLGHVNEVFKTSCREKSLDIFRRYAGNKGIGHVRYATSGSEDLGVAQPFERHHSIKWKWFSFGFNGTIANYPDLKKEILASGDYHLTYENDTEMIMHHISHALRKDKKPDLFKVFSSIYKKFDGCFNIVFINADGEIVILRDPNGFRPLVYGYNEKEKYLWQHLKAMPS